MHPSRRRISLWIVPAVVVALSFALSLPGCTSRPPSEPPSVTGVVTDVQATDAGGSMRVVWTDELQVGEKAAYDAAQVGVSEDTTLRKRTGESEWEEIAFTDVRPGDVVDVWFGGNAVAESYPVQAGAVWVDVIGTFEGELPTPQGLLPEDQPQP